MRLAGAREVSKGFDGSKAYAKNKGKADDDSSARANAPTRWSDYTASEGEGGDGARAPTRVT